MLPVSVIIPCYRCIGTIARAIASVKAQSEAPAEVIIIDDASNDDTVGFLERLCTNYAPGRIRIISLGQNEGPGGARNAGWREATQRYIAFLDADDSWHPLKLSYQIAWLERNPNVMLTGHPCPIFEKSIVARTIPNEIAVREVRRAKILLSNNLPTSSVVLRRDIPYRFDPNKRYSEDYHLWMQIVLSGLPTWRIETPLGFIHKHAFAEGGASANLWKMEKGELDAYRRVWADSLIGFPQYLAISAVSLAKYLRRISVILSFR